MIGLLDGKVAIVTGAGQGVGEGIARALAQAGATAVIAARRAENGEPAAEAIRARSQKASFVCCDVTSELDVAAAIDHAVSQHGRLDIVVHNAVSPPGPPAPIQDVDPAIIEAQIATSTGAAFLLAREAYPYLAASRGSFLLLTSPAGIEGSGNLPVYATVKAAQRGLLKSLAREWGPDGIRVNALAPVAWTPALLTATEANPTLLTRLEARTSLGHIGDPETDIGPVAVFLASDMARHMTGQTLAVDGGRYLGL